MKTKHWKSRLVSAAVSAMLASQMFSCSFAFGQVIPLREISSHQQPHDVEPISAITDSRFKLEPKAAELGAPVFKNDEPQMFQSNLQLPAVSQLAEGTPGILPRSDRLEISSVVAQVAQATVIVVLFCVTSLFLLKKFKAERFFASSKTVASPTNTDIRLLGTIRLAGNRSLELVEADGKRMVVLSGAGEASSLLVLDGTATEAITTHKGSRQAPVFTLPNKKENRHDRLVRQSL